MVFGEKFLVKDLAQLYYSSPGSVITRADRLRFYLAYTGKTKFSICDRILIRKIKSKAKQMAIHDKKHNRYVPYER